jgi:hypothetical protein
VRGGQKLSCGTDATNLLDEAFNMVRTEMGDFPSDGSYSFSDGFRDDETDSLESSLNDIALDQYEALSETEAYMWGLGIAGLVHQWERDTRKVIIAFAFLPRDPRKLEGMRLSNLCNEVEKTGFPITRHEYFSALEIGALIANTIKHGKGKSFDELIKRRSDLFHGGPVGVRTGNLPPEPEHLRVGRREFDAATEAISHIWLSNKEVLSAKSGVSFSPSNI